MSNENKQNKGLENPNQCQVFAGSSAGEYLVFAETWKANMRFQNVQDIILKGTHQGVKLREGCRMPIPDRFKTICLVHNQQIADEAKDKAPIFTMLIQEHPWLIYWWKTVPIPVGKPSSRDPITGLIRNFEEVSRETLFNILDHLPLGCDTILSKNHGVPEGTVAPVDYIPIRHPLSEKYFPGVHPGFEEGVYFTVDEHPMILSQHFAGEFVLAMRKCYAESKLLDYHTLKHLVGEGPPPMRTCEDYEDALEANTQVIVEKTYQGILTSYKALDVELNQLYTKSTVVFSKIGNSALQLVTEELKVGDFHAAYRIIEEHYINKGVSNIESFESDLKLVILEPGRDFTPHWVALQNSLKRLAMVSGIMRDALHHQNKVDGIYIPFVPIINTLEAIANSGVLSDREIEAIHGRVLIPETKRVQILEDSISAKTSRFAKQKESMYEMQVDERTIRTFLAKIILREESKPGQDHKLSETRGSNKLNKDESSNSKSAMISSNENSKTLSGKYPAGSCPNHPKSTTHTLAECNFKGDGKKTIDNSNKTSTDSKNDKSSKTKWVEKYCKHCAANKNLWKNRKTHTTEECSKNNSYPRRSNEDRSNYTPRANVSRKSNRLDDDSDNDSSHDRKRTKSVNSSSIDPEKLSFALANWTTINELIEEQQNEKSSSSSSSSSKGRN
jgi:hypothetical protein